MSYDPKTETRKVPAPIISTDSLLDEALAETFPASDPIAVHRIEAGEAPNPDDQDEHKERRTVRRKRPAGRKAGKRPARKARGRKKAAKKKAARRPAKKRARKPTRSRR
jgi:hypothetical protein